MDIRTGASLQEENGLNFQGNWIPVTPGKPVPTTISGRTNWHEVNGLGAQFSQGNPISNGAVSVLNSISSVDQNTGLNNLGAVLTGKKRSSDHIVGSNAQAVKNQSARWNHKRYADLLALTNTMVSEASATASSIAQRGNNNAAGSPLPMSYAQIQSSRQQFNSGGMPHLDQNFSMSSNLSNRSCPPQIPYYGFPVPYHRKYNDNSSNRTIADAVSNGTISFQLTPVTPDKSKEVQNKQKSEVANGFLNQRSNQQTNMVQDGIELKRKNAIKVHCIESLVQTNVNSSSAPSESVSQPVMDPSSAVLSTPLEANQNPEKGEENGVDPNKEAEHKPKRKKHRPRVVREGKPKRTPKPKVEKANTKEKRKYVRKNGTKASNTPSADVVGVSTDPTPRTNVKSCKRSLKFNLEGEVRDEGQEGLLHGCVNSSSCRLACNSNSATQAQDLCNGTNGMSGHKSTVTLTQGPEVIVEKSPAGIVFDLNHSFTQMPDDISLPEKQAPTTPQPARIVLPKIIAWNVNDTVTTDVRQHSGKKDYPQTLQNMNVEGVRHAVLQAENGYDHKNEVHSKLQSSGHSISKSLNNSNCNQHVVLVEDEQAKGSKRGHCHVTGDTNVRSINLLRSHFISLPENGYDHKYAVQSKLQSSGHSISKSLNNSNCNQHVVMAGDEQAKGSKMGHCHAMGETNVRSINLLGSRFISLPENGYDHKNEVLPKLQSSGHSISRSLNNLNCNQHVALVEDEQAKGSKRGHCHATGETNVRSINLIGSRFNSLPVYQEILRGNEYQRNNGNVGLHFSEIYKKRKTEVAQNKVMSSTPSSMATMENGARQATAYRENHTNPNLCTKNLKNGASNSIHELYSQSMAAGHHCRVQSIPAEVLSRIEAQSRASLDKLQASEILRNIGQTGIMMKKMPKGPTQVHDLASLTTNADRNTIPSTPPKTAPISGYRQGIEIFRRPQALETLAVDNHEASRKQCNGGLALVNKVSHYSANEVKLHGRDHWQSLTKSRGSSDAGPLKLARPFNISIVDEIIQRLNCLNINGGTNMILAQEQKALIPFGGDSRMVPYEGPFDPSKKRPPRPKVDLDQETERVWKFLMGKESNNGDEGTDAVKEKWWEEERRVFRGRADSFIARMHLIQGDRRFTEWKGSVVDSVIGVFLTQNVSDHLSSSAFMSLAARFPLKSTGNNTPCYKEGTDMYVEEPEVCILDSNDPGGSPEDNPKSEKLDICENGLSECHELQQNRKDDKTTGAGCASLVEADRIAIEDLVSSQSSDVSSQNSIDSTILRTTERTMNARMGNANSADTKDRSEPEDVVSSLNFVNSSIPPTAETIRSCSDSYSETEDPVFESISNSLNGSTSFMELLQMAGTTMLQENFGYGSGGIGLPFTQGPIIPTSNYSLHITPNTGVLEVEFPEVLEDKSRFSLPLNASGITQIDDVDCMNKRIGLVAGSVSEPTTQQKVKLSTNHSLSSSKQSVQTLIDSGHQNFHEKQLHSCNNLHGDVKAFQHEDTPTAEPKISVDKLDQRGNSSIQQAYLNLPNFSVETLDVLESTCLEDKQKPIENKVVESSNSKQQKYSSEKARTGETTETLKEKGKFNREKNNAPDWDSIRKEVFRKSPKKERSSDRMDSLDWEAVRCADVNVIADTIKERGMNNMLAERIKAFLNRCVRDHEKIDLEWLRDAPPDKAKEYLLSVRGLGLKSVECVRLLTLHHLAFPVDTNVGRIAVRLGWVPLQPLPESVQLHLLEMYPILESIQKYLWPRLCTLDQRTLYELHYQMITFGKVFCTKSKPNCNACPMRAECKHFASAFASARLALPGPEEKGIVSSTAPIATNENPGVGINRVPILQLEANKHLETRSIINKSEPFIELPASPDPECTEIPESDIEDALFYEDPEEIPTIKLNFKEFALNLQSYMQENNMELQEGDMSKALVALTPDATSIPTPKLKNVSRLRTEHQVYELPDSHPLLKGVERRVPGDICSYLLAIWTPGETAESIQPPERCCSSQISGDLCKEKTCFSCNSIREANSQKVRGTLLIPCKTAMRGSFPLNGTYFQVNEVFADHDSSLNPIDVPRAWIWNLPRRTVYFGTSVTTIFKGQSTEEIQSCFWKGYVCVRGFDQKTRTPRPLMARLHFPASKLAMATKLAKKKTKPAEV